MGWVDEGTRGVGVVIGACGGERGGTGGVSTMGLGLERRRGVLMRVGGGGKL